MVAYWILAPIMVLAAIGILFARKAVHAAMLLAIVMISLALLYLTLNAAFIAAVQVVVYAGAIMVLFIFVIMLLNLGTPEPMPNKLKPQTLLGIFAGLILVGVLVSMLVGNQPTGETLTSNLVGAKEIGLTLFDPGKPWLFPFEVVSILLLVAAVGAVMLAKKRI